MKLSTTRARMLTIAGVGIAAVALIGGTATASSMITAKQLDTGSVNSRVVKDGSVHQRDLTTGVNSLIHAVGQPGPQGVQGPKGDKGEKGDKGDSGLKGAYYSVAKYDVGDTNAGAIATVACNDQTDVAISGGVQVLGIGGTQSEIDAANGRNTPVSSSFPGRMDWSTNSPKTDRLDGWIVQFGGNAGATSDKAPEKVNVWALCVPGANIPVTTTYTESGN